MAAPKKIPVAPPTFHLKVRLVDSTGKPFAGKDFQLWWGGKLVKEDVLDVDGYMEADVDDNYDNGLLDVGEKDKNTGVFVARWTIPVEVVAPPPPPPKPMKHGKPAAKKEKPPEPPAQRGWTDEADPPPKWPEAPRNSDDIDGMARYDRERKTWREWEERRDERMGAAIKQEQIDRDFRDRQKANADLRRDYQAGPGPGSVKTPQDKEYPPMSDAEKQLAFDRYQAFKDALYETQVMLHGLAWRLRNLGYLPESNSPVFPVEGASRDRLFDALCRYAWKNKLPLLQATDLSDVPSSALKKIDDAVRGEHDE
jgi:hypothetical protein